MIRLLAAEEGHTATAGTVPTGAGDENVYAIDGATGNDLDKGSLA